MTMTSTATPLAVTVGYNTNVDSKRFSAYRISVWPADAPPTGKLRANPINWNNQHVEEGVFSTAGDAIAAIVEFVAPAIGGLGLYLHTDLDDPSVSEYAVLPVGPGTGRATGRWKSHSRLLASASVTPNGVRVTAGPV